RLAARECEIFRGMGVYVLQLRGPVTSYRRRPPSESISGGTCLRVIRRIGTRSALRPAEPRPIGGDNAIDQTGVGDEAGRTDERNFLEYALVARGRSPPRGLQGPVRHGVDHARRRGRGCGRGYARAP